MSAVATIDGDQPIHFSRVEGRSVAWSSIGTGPPLVLGGWWSNHLGLDWRNAQFRRFIGPLAQHRTVVRFDGPGTGLSDRFSAVPADVQRQVANLVGLLDLIGLGRVDLLGISVAAPTAVALAAECPERVERLMIYGGYTSGFELAPTEARDSIMTIVGNHWGIGSRMLADFFLPDGISAERAAFAISQRRSMSAEVARASLAAAYAADTLESVQRVRAPALVLHRRGDRAVPVGLGRALAGRIAGSRFIPLDGLNHLPWQGDVTQMTRPLLDFLGVPVPAAPRIARASALTARERDVLRLVAGGLTDQQIAGQLVVSAHTVHRHVANVRRKLGVNSRAAAVAWAVQHGVV